MEMEMVMQMGGNIMGSGLHSSSQADTIAKLRSLEGLEHSPFLKYQSLKLAALRSRLTSRATDEKLPMLPLVLVTSAGGEGSQIGGGIHPCLSLDSASLLSSTSSPASYLQCPSIGAASVPDPITASVLRSLAPGWDVEDAWVRTMPRKRRSRAHQAALLVCVKLASATTKWSKAVPAPQQVLIVGEHCVAESASALIEQRSEIVIGTAPAFDAHMSEIIVPSHKDFDMEMPPKEVGMGDANHKIQHRSAIEWRPRIQVASARERDQSLERLTRRAVELKCKMAAIRAQKALGRIADKEAAPRLKAEAMNHRAHQRSWLIAITLGLRLSRLQEVGRHLDEKKAKKQHSTALNRAAEVIQRRWRSYYVLVFMRKNHARLMPIVTLSKRWQLRIRGRRKKKMQPVLLFVLREAVLCSKVEGAILQFRRHYHCMQNIARNFVMCRRARLLTLLKLWVIEEPRVKNGIITEERNKADAALRATLARLGKEFETLPDARWIPQLARKLQLREKETSQNLLKATLISKRLKNAQLGGPSDAGEDEGVDTDHPSDSVNDSRNVCLSSALPANVTSGTPLAMEGPKWRRRVQEFCEQQPECLVPVGVRLRACEQYLRDARKRWAIREEGEGKGKSARSHASIGLVHKLLHESEEKFLEAMTAANKHHAPVALQIFSGEGRIHFLGEIERAVRSILRDKKRW